MSITQARFTSQLRTWVLIAGLTALLIGIGALLGGGFLPRLNRSSQQWFVDLFVNAHSMLRPESASQVSCGAGC